MSNFTPQPRKKNALDNAALRLYAPNNAGKNASLQVNLRKNQAQFIVWTNDPNDTKDNGKIAVTASLPYAYTWLEMIRAAVRSEGDYRKFIEVKSYIFLGQGKRSEQPMVTGRLIVGKTDGVVWVSVTAHQRPNIQFNFNPGGFNSVRNGDQAEVPLAELTQLYALGWTSLTERVLAQLAVVEYEEPAPKQQNGQGGGGRSWGNNNGGNNGGNGGGGYGGGNNGGGGGGGNSGATAVNEFDGW